MKSSSGDGKTPVMEAPSRLLIEVPEIREPFTVGEVIPLRLVFQRPEKTDPVIIRQIDHRDPERVALSTDLLQRDVTLHGGECLDLTIGVEFRSSGPANLHDFYVQVDPVDGQPGQLVRFPERKLRVVPTMRSAIEVSAERICAYDQAVKMEVTVRNTGMAAWEDFVIGVGPSGKVRSGITLYRRARLEIGQTERFEVVLSPDSLELMLAGTRNGDRVTNKKTFPVTLEGESHPKQSLYQFLEPRALTSDQITICGEEDNVQVHPRRGVYPLKGAGKSYRLTIHPNDATATNVELHGKPGKVEVKRIKCEDRDWIFDITPISSPLFPEFVRLYYDVTVPGRVLAGEIYVAVQPTNAHLWTFAATAGAALTIKGMTGVVQTILTPDRPTDELWFDIIEMIRRNWMNGLQLLSIPIFRFILSLACGVCRWYRGW